MHMLALLKKILHHKGNSLANSILALNMVVGGKKTKTVNLPRMFFSGLAERITQNLDRIWKKFQLQSCRGGKNLQLMCVQKFRLLRWIWRKLPIYRGV